MTKCKKLTIPVAKDVCYIQFKKDKVKHSEDIGYSARGEQMIVDYNKNDDIIGIELLGSPLARKPCQEGKKK